MKPCQTQMRVYLGNFQALIINWSRDQGEGSENIPAIRHPHPELVEGR